jgi:hypothetical protein
MISSHVSPSNAALKAAISARSSGSMKNVFRNSAKRVELTENSEDHCILGDVNIDQKREYVKIGAVIGNVNII